MSLESDLKDALGALVGGRCYPDVGPKGVARPYITYQGAGGQPINFLRQEVPSKRNARVQLNAWDDTRNGAAALGRTITDTMRLVEGLQVTSLGEPVSVYEEETGLYGTHADYSVWF